MISILIITYNRSADLLELLESISMQEGLEVLQEVLILNNASDESYLEVESFLAAHPELKANYIVSPENLGVSRGRNHLMKMASGELLLVLDDDILFQQKEDLQKIATVFNKPFFKEANTAVITFRVIYYETKEQQQTALPHKQFLTYRDKPQFLTSYYTGCSHLMKRDILAETGYYPVDFFYGMEEYDLSYRIIKAGYSLGYDAGVTFEHKESPLGRQAGYKKLSSQWINKSKVAWRYLPVWYYITTMIAWSIEYIRKSGGQWQYFFRSWAKVLAIPFSTTRTPVGRSAMNYLKQVKARLWY